MRRVVNMRLCAEDIDNVISLLEKRKTVLEQKGRELAIRLAMLGKDVAERYYGQSNIDNNNVSVSIEYKGNTFYVHANGKEVCFLEFGAGTRTNSSHPYSDSMPFDVSAGSWSIQDKQQFITWGYWFVGKRKLEYVEPTNAMYHASLQIQEQVYKIAKEVLGRMD